MAQLLPLLLKCNISINIQHVGTWLSFKQYKPIHNKFFYTSIFRFIRNFEIPVLFNRQLCVNMGKDRGGVIFLDPTINVPFIYYCVPLKSCYLWIQLYCDPFSFVNKRVITYIYIYIYTHNIRVYFINIYKLYIYYAHNHTHEYTQENTCICHYFIKLTGNVKHAYITYICSIQPQPNYILDYVS